MLPDQIARATVATRLEALPGRWYGPGEFANLEFRTEDPAWVRAEARAQRSGSLRRPGWLSWLRRPRRVAEARATNPQPATDPSAV